MNYRHLYHAGNFSDVLKHIVLIGLIKALQKKDKPFCYLDTHAGAGEYNLADLNTEQTRESKLGIFKIIDNNQSTTPKLIKVYLDSVLALGFPYVYPGSPKIAESCLRPEDSMILTEWHQDEYESLKRLFNNTQKSTNISIHHQDGYLALKAFLPPKERRALVLIDTPFEKSNEWKNILQGVHNALQRLETAVMAIWYPLKDLKAVSLFQHALKKEIASFKKDILFCEMAVYPMDAALGLMGCGMAIVNPPWQFNSEMQTILPWLWQNLSVEGAGQFRIF